jgi:cyclophilin family peptidyl-prolyl cis-trans isomerase
MAKTNEPNSANSQFYINLKDNLRLDSNYSVFGKVTAGMEVVDAVGNTPTGADDRPLQDITITKAELIE